MTSKETIVLEAIARTATGKKVRALRRENITPIHIYGKGLTSLTLQADTHLLQQTLHKVGRTVPLTVRVQDEEHFVFAREIQRHPVSDRLIHVDFLRVSLTERITSDVPVELTGEAPGARVEGASVSHDLYSLSVEALPMDLPPIISVDISGLSDVGSAVHAGDLSLGSGVSLITDPSAVIARIVAMRTAEGEGEQATVTEEETSITDSVADASDSDEPAE